MAFRQPLTSMAHNDDQLYDLAQGMPDSYTPPDYPSTLCFTVPQAVLEQAGGADGDPDDTMPFSAMGEVTSIFRGRDDCRIELRLTQFAGEDGKFVELDDNEDMSWMCPSICLCASELERMNLEADCDLGDTLHLIGTVRLESLSNDGFSGEQARLQIVELSFIEDESSESRKG